MGKQTIIQKIQPNCDNLYKEIKAATIAQHKTHRDIVENTGVPRSTVAKFLSGSISNPGVFFVSAICIYLGLSLNELMGITPPPPEQDESAVEIAELKGKLSKSEMEAALLREHCKIYEAGIAERKPIIYGLTGLCIFLSMAFVTYLLIDISDSAHGFIRPNQPVSPVFVLLVLAIISTAFITVHSVVKKIMKSKRSGE